VELGGTRGEGQGGEGVQTGSIPDKIAGIAEIARHRRDRKSKTYHGGAEARRTATI
jgi:hypothetical protein